MVLPAAAAGILALAPLPPSVSAEEVNTEGYSVPDLSGYHPIKTYFFDIKKTKEDKPYLVITESRFKGEGKERERVSIAIFPENTEEFAEAVGEMTAKIRKDE